MLPPANRLRKEKEIKRVLASRKSCKNGLLICKTALNGLDAARFCFVVSKRISNKAVIRNRLKRHLREAVAAFLPLVRSGTDYVLIACPKLQDCDFRELLVTMEKLLSVSGGLANQKRV